MVQPEHKGRCPTCKSFLQANTISRKHPINVSKRAAILADLLVEFKPTTTMATATCEHLAATLERLNNARPGSVDWTRLISASQTLAAALRGPEVRPPDLSFMTLAQLEARSLELAAECRVAASQPEPVVAPTAVVEVPLVPADEVQATLVEAPLPTCAYCGNRPTAHCITAILSKWNAETEKPLASCLRNSASRVRSTSSIPDPHVALDSQATSNKEYL
jgi:hypothetical protein